MEQKEGDSCQVFVYILKNIHYATVLKTFYSNSPIKRLNCLITWQIIAQPRASCAVTKLCLAGYWCVKVFIPVALRIAGRDLTLLRTPEPLTPLALNSHHSFPVAMYTLQFQKMLVYAVTKNIQYLVDLKINEVKLPILWI